MPTITIRMRSADGVTPGRVLHQGEHDDLGAAVAHCAAAGVSLAHADLRAAVLDGRDLSGLHASGADLSGASCKRIVADRVVGGRKLDLSSAALFDTDFEGADLSVAILACTRITKLLGVRVSTATDLGGCDLAACPDVLPLGRDASGEPVVAIIAPDRSWQVHASAGGVMPLDTAKVELCREINADDTAPTQFRQAFDALERPTGRATKEAIEQRAATRIPAGETGDGGIRGGQRNPR